MLTGTMLLACAIGYYGIREYARRNIKPPRKITQMAAVTGVGLIVVMIGFNEYLSDSLRASFLLAFIVQALIVATSSELKNEYLNSEL